MQLLLLTDVHGEVDRLERLLEKAGEVDHILLAGDLTDFGPAEDARAVVNEILDYAPLSAVPGNCDPAEVDAVLDEAGLSVDGSVGSVDGFDLVGLGGSNSTPFDTVREFTEDELRERLKVAEEAEEPWILLSHAPPHKSLDLTSGNHVGSKAVLETVRELSPRLVATGHVHESRGDMYMGGSYVVNPGPVMDGRGAVVDMGMKETDDELDVTYLKVK